MLVPFSDLASACVVRDSLTVTSDTLWRIELCFKGCLTVSTLGVGWVVCLLRTHQRHSVHLPHSLSLT